MHQISYILKTPHGGRQFLRFNIESKTWLIKTGSENWDQFNPISIDLVRHQFEVCKIWKVRKPTPGYRLMMSTVYEAAPASCKTCKDPLNGGYSQMCQSCLLLLLDEENDKPALTLTMYQYEDQEEDAELEPDYQLTNTLYEDEPMSFNEIVRKVRDYDARRTSCEPVCQSGHCWLSSDAEQPNFGNGGLTYVDVFVKTLRGEPVSGPVLQKIRDLAIS